MLTMSMQRNDDVISLNKSKKTNTSNIFFKIINKMKLFIKYYLNIKTKQKKDQVIKT